MSIVHDTKRAALNAKPYPAPLMLGRLLSLLFLAFCLRAQAQYSVDWHTIDGGGGTSTGGVYAVSGTIGQPDADTTMTNGPYSLTGGFWSVLAIQTPGAPLLKVIYTATNTVVVSWPLPATGWVLQQTNQLPNVAVPWPQVPSPYITNATEIFILVAPPVTGHRFYRLNKP